MKKFSYLLAFLLFSAGGIFCYNNYYFSPDKILENSILKDRNFKANVSEVVVEEESFKAYLLEDKSVPLVVINFSFDKAGRAYEPKNGVSLFTEGLIFDGAGKYSKKELRKVLKEKGIKISASSDNDSFNFSVSYVKEFEDVAKDVLKSVIYSPMLNGEDIDVFKKQVKMLKIREKEKPQYELFSIVKDEFYKSYPYGKDNYPSDEEIDSLSALDIRNYMQNYFAKDVLSVGAAGFIDEKELTAFLSDVFMGLKDKTISNDLPVFEPIYNNEVVSKDASYSKQTFALHIRDGIKRLDEDFYPFYIADYILGGSGLNSRLNKSIREKEGLTYGIYSYLSDNDAGSFWNISYSATNENAIKIEEILEKELNDFYENGITNDELELAKNSLISSFNLRFASLFNIALQLNLMLKQNLGRDFLEKRQDMVRAITIDDVNRVIKTRFSKNKRIFMLKANEN